MNDERPPIDTENRWFIGRQAGDLVILRPPHRLTKDEALVLAAHLVAMVHDDERWQEILAAVQST